MGFVEGHQLSNIWFVLVEEGDIISIIRQFAELESKMSVAFPSESLFTLLPSPSIMTARRMQLFISIPRAVEKKDELDE
jgi:hypothetical protein